MKIKLYLEKRKIFPDPDKDSIDGIVAMGDFLGTNTLLEAYSFGIFPWPNEGLPLLWYCPDPRGVLDFKELHISRSLKKLIDKKTFQVTFNQNFKDVIIACSEAYRPGQMGSWITPPMLKAYVDFHNAGYAHSVEVWRGSYLVGGLYGVYVGGVFSGESMFFKESNTSKVALVALIELLKENGLTWMDIQMVTPVTENLGGKYISRKEFLKRIEKSKAYARPINWKKY